MSDLIPSNFIKSNVEEYPNDVPKNPLVSVCIQTYNQEKYIGKCIESILDQKTDFDYEIIIGDDESSDKTREICIDYAKKFPKKIRLLLHKRENVIYIGNKPIGRFNGIYNMQSANGKYLAYCEGDDYWSCTTKLQKQTEIMESDDECALVFSNHAVLKKDKSIVTKHKKDYLKSNEFFDLHYILKKNIIPATPTRMFRKSFIPTPFPKFVFECFSGDWAYLFLITHGRKIKYINEVTAVYREGVGVVAANLNSFKFRNGLNLCKQLNKETGFEYNYHLGKYEWHNEHLTYSYIEEGRKLKGLFRVPFKLYYSIKENPILSFLPNNKLYAKHTFKLLFGKLKSH